MNASNRFCHISRLEPIWVDFGLRHSYVLSCVGNILGSDAVWRFSAVFCCWRGFSVRKHGSVFRFARFGSEFCAVNLEFPAAVCSFFFEIVDFAEF